MPKETDQKAEALRLSEVATENFEKGYLKAAEHQRQKALIHSNLAIAEGQDRVAEQLERIGDRLDAVTGEGKDQVYVKAETRHG
jgi:hypothetical protein